jgi:glycerophosphoryl diester phosphodiesterase
VSLWPSAGARESRATGSRGSPRALVVGHRGGRGEGWPPENTLAAFEQARAQGARAIELDVRTCGTGEDVVAHDPTRATLAELRAQGVPTLGEVLAWARERDVAVNVELKHDVPSRVALLERARRSLRHTRADVLLSSFDPLLLAGAAAALPGVPRALLTSSRQRPRVPLAVASRPYVQALHLQRTQTEPATIARCRRRGLRVGVWTVNDPREAVDLVALGVETLITDAPGLLLAALASPRDAPP